MCLNVSKECFLHSAIQKRFLILNSIYIDRQEGIATVQTVIYCIIQCFNFFWYLLLSCQEFDMLFECVADSQKEKNVRASLKAEVERWVCHSFLR